MAGLRIAAIRLMSREPQALAAFFAEALGFKWNNAGGLHLGEERVEIERTEGAPTPADLVSNDTRFQHFAVIVSDMDAAYVRLQSVKGWTPISTRGPEQLPQASGGVTAFKFHSPEGHPLELLQFPEGKAPAPWNARSGLHLGIDHSAIGVSDTERSIAFYTRLGFTLAARQTNRGAEQARLDGLVLDDPAVEVTSLTPPGSAPPHLELLCYRRPEAIASPPAEEKSIAATRLILSGMSAPVRDPDGHLLLPDG
ncbi:VOC family protein [Aureimonas psammosilenae]|uniref:VOC family protein n=1 Tax=Aureimonas psammosilenae TaxID=2495496 RepID=UPI001260C7E6|nr:VOC family protein [Aureimonas psammosilenae]